MNTIRCTNDCIHQVLGECTLERAGHAGKNADDSCAYFTKRQKATGDT